MANPKFSDEFRANAVKLAKERGDRSIKSIAKQLNVSVASLHTWLRRSKEQLNELSSDSKNGSSADKMQALMESHRLSGEELSQWCRMKGVFTHQLQAWKNEFITHNQKKSDALNASEFKALKQKNRELEFDLKRNNLALAESAALLVLSKKYNALISVEKN